MRYSSTALAALILLSFVTVPSFALPVKRSFEDFQRALAETNRATPANAGTSGMNSQPDVSTSDITIAKAADVNGMLPRPDVTASDITITKAADVNGMLPRPEVSASDIVKVAGTPGTDHSANTGIYDPSGKVSDPLKIGDPSLGPIKA